MVKFVPSTPGTFSYFAKEGKKEITVNVFQGKSGLMFKSKNHSVYAVDDSRTWIMPVVKAVVETPEMPVKAKETLVHTIVAKTVETTVKTHRGRPSAILGVREFRTPSVLNHMKIDKDNFKVMIVPSNDIPEGAIIEQRKSMRKFTRCLDSESIVLIKK